VAIAARSIGPKLTCIPDADERGILDVGDGDDAAIDALRGLVELRTSDWPTVASTPPAGLGKSLRLSKGGPK
jgi:hypothetical protein